MDVFPKFIIETDDEVGDCLIIAKCTYHKELTVDKTKVKGGGWWRFDQETNTFTLYGDSSDFGPSSIEDIKACIENGNVYTNYTLTHSIADKHNFNYDTQSEIIELKKLPTFNDTNQNFKTWDELFEFQAKKDGANYNMLKNWLKKYYEVPNLIK